VSPADAFVRLLMPTPPAPLQSEAGTPIQIHGGSRGGGLTYASAVATSALQTNRGTGFVVNIKEYTGKQPSSANLVNGCADRTFPYAAGTITGQCNSATDIH